MGGFLAVSAFRTESPAALAAAAAESLRAAGIACEALPPAEEDGKSDAHFFPPAGGWSVVMWPWGFGADQIEIDRAISRALAVCASSVHEHDGDYWVHALIDRGAVLDVFASWPDYFSEDPEEIASLKRKWKGNAAVIARHTGVTEHEIAPYLVHLDPEDESEAKAHQEDEFDLGNIWVFTDLWRRLGITYPEDLTSRVALLRLAPDYLYHVVPGDYGEL